MSQIVQIIAKRLRNYRIQQGLTQEELAERSNLHYTYIGQVERGEKNITISSLEKILDSLNISFPQLFENINTPVSDDIPRQCYDMIFSLSKEKQKIVYEILCDIEKLSR